MNREYLQSVLKIDTSRRFVRKYLGIIAFLISLILASVFFAFNAVTSRTIEKQLEDQGRAFFSEIVNTRHWIAHHGGVYVPLDTAGEVNKYLKNIEGVEAVIECGGREYTLKNPALVTRELSESNRRSGGRVGYKITSLILMNPGNAADEFESDALRRFEQGEKVVSTISEQDGKTYYRYMAPLMTTEACLKCHVKQGYKVGDIRGGIAVSIPAGDVERELHQARVYMVIGGISVIVLVVLSIVYISRHFIKDLQAANTMLEEMALFDSMTKLYNRLTGMSMLKKEIARAGRDGRPLCVAILDIDHFKKVNDTYGHTIGDEVLVAMARTLQGHVRESDLACRYGGEEFLLIMPDTGRDDAATVVSRLLEKVRDMSVETGKGPVTFTFSSGVAQFQAGEESDGLINRADTLLYEAKAEGRNRVCHE